MVPGPAAALPPLDAAFRRVTTREGLSHDSISALLQDREGFLWIGTAAGLNRYDGHRLTRYHAEDGLAHDQITRLLQARDGTLWIATHDGLSRRDPTTGKIETPRLRGLPALLGRLHINALAETPDGHLWIGTGVGLLRLHTGSLTVTHVLPKVRITHLLVHPDGPLWLGSPDGAVLRLNPASGAVTPAPGVPPLRQVRGLLRAADGALWIAASRERMLVGRLDAQGGWRWFTPQPADSPAQPMSLAEDGEGGLFLGSDDGLWHLDARSGVLARRYGARPRVEDALPDSFVAALLTDNQRGLWLGTPMGLLRLELRTPRFPLYRETVPPELGPPGGHVWALREDLEGGIWVGTRRGLGWLDRRTQRFRHVPDVEAVRDLHVEPDGRLFVATYGGLLLLAGAEPGAARRWLRLRPGAADAPDSLPDDRVNRVLADDGSLYLGMASAGLCQLAIPARPDAALTVRRFACSNQDPSRIPCQVTALLAAGPGLLYVGGRTGVFLFDPRAGRVLRAFTYQAADPTSLSHSMVLSLLRGRTGDLWVGTSGGLNRLPAGTDPRTQPARFARFTRPLLPDDNINGIVEDRAGQLWLTTNNGLLRFAPDRQEVLRFDVLDGLAANEFDQGAVALTRAGEVLVGSPAGFNLFAPATAQPIPTLLAARITGVWLNGQPQPVVERLAPLTSLRRLEVAFSVPDFDRPQRVRALYRLEGLDSGWTEAPGAGTVTYGALPPGGYRFQVRGRSADGALEPVGAGLSLWVERAWWQTPWAYAAWMALVIALLLGTHRLRVARLQQRSAELEARVEERTATLRIAQQEAVAAGQAKSEFLALMSHELRTPLNAVLGATGILERTALSGRQGEMLHLIRGGGQLLMSLINDLLDFSKLEASKLALHPVPVSLREFLRGSVGLLMPQADAKGLRVDLDIAAAVPEWVSVDPTRLRQVLINLLGNALKFTDRGGVQVRVEATPLAEQHLLRVMVQDTGPGIPLVHQATLFQPFTVGDPALAQRVGGTGLGLVICHRLCALMGGDIQLFSEPGHGATFTFTVRVGRAAAPAAAPRPQRAAEPLGLRVLLCEDHPLNQQTTRGMLTVLGCSVTVVGDGAAGLQAAQAERFDVVLMDVMMPGMNGLEATRRLRALPPERVGRPWVIAMSAGALPNERRRCEEAGMDDFLSKPAWLEDLEAALQRTRPQG